MPDPVNTAPVEPPVADEPGSDEGVNWGDLNNVAPGADDDDDQPAGDVPAADPAPAAPAADPAVPPVTPAPAQPPVAPVQPAAQQPTAAEVAEAQRQFNEKLTTGMAEQFTKEISEEDARELIANPEKVLPKLMAKASIAGMQMAMHFMQQTLPQVVRQQANEQLSGRELEQQFYSANRDLSAHKTVVNKMVSVAKETLEPGASTEDILKEAASLARRKLKLAEPVASAAPPAPDPAGAPKPYAPVKSGGARPTPAATPAKPASDNIWTELADD